MTKGGFSGLGSFNTFLRLHHCTLASIEKVW
jgi:hypothetical protein